MRITRQQVIAFVFYGIMFGGLVGFLGGFWTFWNLALLGYGFLAACGMLAVSFLVPRGVRRPPAAAFFRPSCVALALIFAFWFAKRLPDALPLRTPLSSMTFNNAPIAE